MRCESCGIEKQTTERDGKQFCLSCLSKTRVVTKPAASPTPSPSPTPTPPSAGPPQSDTPPAHERAPAGNSLDTHPSLTEVLCPSCSTVISTDLDPQSVESVLCLQCGMEFARRGALTPSATAGGPHDSPDGLYGAAPAGLERPLGVTIIGMLGIVSGTILLGAMAVLAWLRLTAETVATGPSFTVLIVTLSAIAILTIVVGSGLRSGRRWAWHLATYMYACGAVGGFVAYIAFPEARGAKSSGSLIPMLMYTYMMGAKVRGYFGLPQAIPPTTFLKHVAAAAAWTAITVGIGRNIARPAHERPTPLQEAEGAIARFERAQAKSKAKATEQRTQQHSTPAHDPGPPDPRQPPDRPVVPGPDTVEKLTRFMQQQAEDLQEAEDLQARRVKLQNLVSEATSLLAREMVDSAIEHFTSAIEIDPECAVAYYGRGIAYAKKKDPHSARQDFLTAIDLDGDGQSGSRASKALRSLKW